MTIYHHVLTTEFSRAYLVAAGVVLLALALTIVPTRVGRKGLAGAPVLTGRTDTKARQPSGGKMKLTIFAATGGIGWQLLEQVVAQATTSPLSYGTPASCPGRFVLSPPT